MLQLYATILTFSLVSFSSGAVFWTHLETRSGLIPPKSRIIGGNAATLGQFPYTVALQIIVERPVIGTCGAALIASNYVLTAAHCTVIYDTIHMEVHFGTLDLQRENPDHLVVVVPKEDFISHKDYDQATVQYDIALLRLSQNVAFTDNIRPIALPTRSDASLNLVGKTMIASGWGRYSDDEPGISEYLRYTAVTGLNQKICKHFFSATLPSTVCTYTDLGKGPCNSDSGGPLAYTDNDTKPTILVGIVSFGGPSCVKGGWPTGYARVTSFLDWIEANSDIEILP